MEGGREKGVAGRIRGRVGRRDGKLRCRTVIEGEGGRSRN